MVTPLPVLSTQGIGTIATLTTLAQTLPQGRCLQPTLLPQTCEVSPKNI